MEDDSKGFSSASTKELLLSAALDIFAERGYAATGLQEVAERVGIRKSSIYNHYPSKEALLEGIFALFRSLLPDPSVAEVGLKRFSGADPAETLRNSARSYAKDWADERAAKAWFVVSEEQYVDRRAAELILEATDRYISITSMLFRILIPATAEGDPFFLEDAAASYAYGVRSAHLEYGLRDRFGLDSESALRRLEAHSFFFGRMLAEKESQVRKSQSVLKEPS